MEGKGVDGVIERYEKDITYKDVEAACEEDERVCPDDDMGEIRLERCRPRKSIGRYTLLLHSLSHSQRANPDSDPNRQCRGGSEIRQPSENSIGIGVEGHERQQHERTLERHCHPRDPESGDSGKDFGRFVLESEGVE